VSAGTQSLTINPTTKEITMSQITEFKPAIVDVVGATVTERKLSVVYGASSSATLALTTVKGKVGKLAASRAATIGLHQISKHASNANYRPAAEFFAAKTGKPFVISNRSAFESLPDTFEMSIMAAKASKSGGYTTDKKTGMQKPNSTLSLAMELKAIAVDMIALAADFHAERTAERANTQAITA
jgi:hypothetical protein